MRRIAPRTMNIISGMKGINMKHNYKMVLQYEGTRYDGWQRQGNSADTIQGKLEAVLERLAGEPVEVHGSGRTDAGVHAMGQTAHFFLSEAREPETVRAYLNRYLPEDINVLSLETAPERFHSRLNAVRKVYGYQIETGPKRDVFVRRMQYGLGQELDVEAMRTAARILTGTHDFKSFCGNKNMKKSTVRSLTSVTIRQEGSMVVLAYVGNGFLQHMVRIMTGTLIEVGLGRREPEAVREILAARERQAAGFTAPPEGLTLSGVLYE